MEIVKVVDKKYIKPGDLGRVVQYATDPDKCYGLIGGCGVNPFDPKEMAFQMQMIKKSFGKEDFGRRQLRHIIVSLQPEWEVPSKIALAIANDIAAFYSDRYQIIFGIHQDTEHIHIHFVQNTVSYLDGKMFSGAFKELDSFKAYVKEVLGRYIPQCKCTFDDFLQSDCLERI